MKTYIAWILLAVAVVGVAYLGYSKPKPAAGEPIKIGISTILSGDFAAAGENMVNAARLAVEEVNAEGGIDGRPLELVVQDAGWDSRTGLSAAQKLVNTDDVRYIIGGTSSNGTLAAAPLVNERKVVYITPVTGGANVDAAGEYVFRLANADVLAGRDIAQSMTKLGHTRVAVVNEVTEYTLDIRKTFEETITASGGTVVLSEEFQPHTTDFRTVVAKVDAAEPDAVLVLSQTGLGGAHFVKQARDAGMTPPFFSDFTFLSNQSAKEVVGSFDGIYFADPAYDAGSPETQAFIARYTDRYGKPPLIAFHALATRDSVMLIAEALRETGDDSEKVHDWLLANVQDYKGLMGTLSLDAEGNSNLGFVVKVMRADVPEPVTY